MISLTRYLPYGETHTNFAIAISQIESIQEVRDSRWNRVNCLIRIKSGENIEVAQTYNSVMELVNEQLGPSESSP